MSWVWINKIIHFKIHSLFHLLHKMQWDIVNIMTYTTGWLLKTGPKTKFINSRFHKRILKKTSRNNPEIKEFCHNYFKYNIFEVVTSWLDTVLSLFFTLSMTAFVTSERMLVIFLPIASYNSVTVWGSCICALSFK